MTCGLWVWNYFTLKTHEMPKMLQLRTPYKYIHIFGQVALNYLWFYKWLEERQCSRGVYSTAREIQMHKVQVSPWLLAGLVLCSPELKSVTTLVNSQLVHLLPVGILDLVIFYLNYLFHIPEKPHKGRGELCIFIVIVTWKLQRSLLLGNQSRHNMHAP